MMLQFKGLFSWSMKNMMELFHAIPLISNIQDYFIKRKVPKGLPNVKDHERVSDRVYRVLGLNPGPFTLQGTNTWLITGKKGTTDHILIDTGEASSSDRYCSLLFNKVFPITGTKRISKILISHGHHDHQGGINKILCELKKRSMLPLPTIHKRIDNNDDLPIKIHNIKVNNITDKEFFEVDKETSIQAIFTPGHTNDHVSFILPQEKALFSGDCVLGCGTAVFSDLYEYMKTLHHLLDLLENSEIKENKENDKLNKIYPGHGPIILNNAKDKIKEYIEQRSMREKQIIKVLYNLQEEKSGDKRISSWEIVNKVYDPLFFIVKLAAQRNVSLHLEKLKKEGKVEEIWPDLWKLSEK